MTGGSRSTPGSRAAAADALSAARRRAAPARPAAAPGGMLGLQRAAGNAAVGALLRARLMSPGDAALADIDVALRELRRDEPAIEPVETGLKAAKAAGVPVDLEGQKPPPAALAVTTTGFGPAAVAAKKPVPPPKPVPAVSPLGKAGAGKAPRGRAGGAAAAPPPRTPAVVDGPAAGFGDLRLRPPTPPPGVRPEQDPAFTAVTGSVKRVAAAARTHPPAAAKAGEAQAAAVPPAGDVAGQAKAAKADAMDAQQPGTFDKQAFVAAVKTAIEAKSPKTLKEADDYHGSGKAGEVKGAVKGLVTQGKDGQTRDIAAATAAPPDASKAVPKPVVPMAPEEPGHAPTVPAAGAVPKPAPADQTNLAAGKHQANQEMAEGEVSETQLAQSGEPQFEQALADKKEAAAHADTAPAAFRAQEKEVLAQHRTDAAAETGAGVAGMQSAKGAALAKLVADKGKTKSKDEARRAEVTGRIDQIFTATEADVKKLLDGIDPKVEAAFENGEAAARAAFERFVAAKMSAYKKDRYGGWLGGLRWAKDKLLGMPDKVNEFYTAGRELYLKQMDAVISRVADIVGNDLTAAKRRIAQGRSEIAVYVKGLPRDLQKVGAEASQAIGERFQQLESDVDAKQEAVVDTLATKYVESRKGLDERIEALQAENKGLVDKAIGAIKAVINTIRELAAMLKNVLSRVAGVVGDIIKAPVAFLGNLIAGVKGGILKFADNILDHLRKGLMSWLFGALAEGGVEIPDKLDVRGVVKLLASLFGLTWTNIRNRLVRKIGEKAMTAAEKGVAIFQIIRTEGVAGLWQMLVEKLGDIKEMILEQVRDFVVTRIITAGITWLIGLLNPAAAFIKACKLIYDVVMFFVNNAGRILKFVNTVIDSVADIVRGNVGGVVTRINDVLGQMVPILIGFLASVIGLGGIGEKIRAIVQKLQKPVNKALDLVITTGLKLAGPLIRGLAGVSGRVKAKIAAGKAWVKGKVAAGKEKVAGVLGAIPAAFGFRAGGEAHRVYIEKSGTPRVMVASNPAEAGAVLAHYGPEIAAFPATTPAQTQARRVLLDHVDTARGRLGAVNEMLSGGRRATEQKLSMAQYKLGQSMGAIFEGVHRQRMKLAGQVPGYTTPGGEAGASTGSVRCVATVTVSCGAKERPYPSSGDRPANTRGTAVDTSGTPTRTAHEMDLEHVLTGRAGGFVIASDAATEMAERKAEFVTRATGDEATSTHAEARLLTQIEAMLAKDPAWSKRIRAIEINISHSPCPSCVDQLLTLRKRLDNPGLRVSIVRWGTRYRLTTDQGVNALRRSYTSVGGP
ncbi:hypothetical protein [Nakamurella deserti]|uniref:hypothetical protein n=1 Tax=Nakamurella deserti TaxID=2164074 RepID=UPI000DBE3227|nr:hypothetical protein [Nakamurella deserti]